MLKRTASLFFCILLAAPAGPVLADEFDAIISEPPKPETEPEVPFFGDQVIVEEEKPEPKPKSERRPVAEKPKPERRPVAEAKPRRQSNRLEIPADAARRNDLSFLKGCWYFERQALSADAPGAPFLGMIQDRFCFNGSGRGTFTQRYVDSGREYSSPATARFAGGRLVLHHPAFVNGPRITQCPETYTCEGQDAGTVCQTYNAGTRYLSRHGSLRISRRP